MKRRRRRYLSSAVALVVVALVALAVLGRSVYQHPRTDRVDVADPADVVVALGGDWRTAPAALQMVHDGRARRAVLSDPYDGGLVWCQGEPPPDRTCFVPDPDTTRGEAREIARLARENNWDDVAVVLPTYHVSRAREIIARCYSGRLRMVDARASISGREWVYQYGYQTAGFARAWLQRGC